MNRLFLPIISLCLIQSGCVLLYPHIYMPKRTFTQYSQYNFQEAVIIANDGTGTFLGKITNRYDNNSIFNKYGNYGSKYNSTSIWNPYGQYGSKYSSYSAFNDYTYYPPKIIKNNKIIGYLTTNKYIQGAVNPYFLLSLY